MKIAVVVPTMESRKDIFQTFLDNWLPLFMKHEVSLFVVLDSELLEVRKYNCKMFGYSQELCYSDELVGHEINDLIYNFNDGVRNIGLYLAYIDRHDYILTLDDDVLPPEGKDPIQEHLDALNAKYPISWLSSTKAGEAYMRGFPYGIRNEAEAIISHGVWLNVPDYDAPTQLVTGGGEVEFYKGVVPKGALFPMCIMNVMMKREAIPLMYQAPMGKKLEKEKGWKLDRFADIWAGVEAKLDCDNLGKAIVTGYSTINHSRASNVFTNLKKEANGIEINEDYLNSEYRKFFLEKRAKWQELLKKYE